MKLRFNREELVETLSAICSVASSRSPKEILKCARLEAQSDVLLVTATDLEIGLRSAVIQVEVEEPGEVLVVADTLAKIVRECSDEVMTLETEGSTLHVRGAGSHFKIVTQAAEDFPAVAVFDGDADFTIAHTTLQRLVEWTLFASARESTRYAINGVLWEIEDDSLALAATDGRRLSVARAKLEDASGAGASSAIVPSKALSLLAKLGAEADACIAVKLTANQMLLKVGRAMLSTSLIEGHFPKYRDVIPKDCDRMVMLNTSEFHSALKRAALLTNDESKGVRLAFGDGTLTLSSRAPEQGEATISLPVKYDGEPTEMGFNPTFLMDVLRVSHVEEIRFAFKEANRPGVLQIGDDFVHVVMPVNLSSA